MYHAGSATIKRYVTSPIISFHFTKNRLYTLLVNYEAQNLIKYVPWTILSHIADMIRDIALSVLEKGRKREVYKANALGEMMGLLYIPAYFRGIWENRIHVQKHIRKITDEEIIGKDSGIVVPRPLLPESLLRKIKKLATFGKMP